MASNSSTKTVRHYHHGRSPAAWAGVTITGIGFMIATAASVMGPNWTLVWISAAVIVLGLVVAGVLKAAGYSNG